MDRVDLWITVDPWSAFLPHQASSQNNKLLMKNIHISIFIFYSEKKKKIYVQALLSKILFSMFGEWAP